MIRADLYAFAFTALFLVFYKYLGDDDGVGMVTAAFMAIFATALVYVISWGLGHFLA